MRHYGALRLFRSLIFTGVIVGLAAGSHLIGRRQPSAVERSFSLFKQWRGIATRYDKLALTYRAAVVIYAVVIYAVVIWLRQ